MSASAGILFDASQAGTPRAGCGELAYGLGCALAKTRDDIIFADTFGSHVWTETPFSSSCDQEFNVVAKFAKHSEAKQFWDRPFALVERSLGYPEVVHANNFYCPVGGRAPVVYTIHDTVVFDTPEYTDERNRAYCAHQMVRASLYADYFVANSSATKDAFLKHFDVDPRRIQVVPLGSKFGWSKQISEKAEDGPPYFLFVGTLEPRKNLDGVLRGFAAAKLSGVVAKLKIVGRLGWMTSALDPIIEALGLSQDVEVLGYVPDDRLADLMGGARALVLASHAEGFGMPAVEALSVGVPVIASDIAALKEVCGPLAFYCDPSSELSISNAFCQAANLSGDSRSDLAQECRRRAANFTWREAAILVGSVYDRAIQSDPSGVRRGLRVVKGDVLPALRSRAVRRKFWERLRSDRSSALTKYWERLSVIWGGK